ncbi:MAG: insulinase family protein [Proteobacteria bacterium]|nr:MAG: insulinase family protein [Pseudomonadota bacterium]
MFRALGSCTIFLTIMISESANAQFKLPPMTETTLDNGLHVTLIEQHEVPLIAAAVTVRAGSVNDGKAWGLASMATAGVDLGTKAYSKKQIEEIEDQNAFQISTTLGKEYLAISAESAAEDAPTLMKLLGELVKNPVYPAKEFDKLRDRVVSQSRKSKESPNQIATDVFERLYYGAHPYASPENGVAETLSKITAGEVQAFHKAYFQPQISAIVIAGDFDSKTMKELIGKEFSTWKKGTAKATKIEALAEGPKETEVILIDKPDARETTFRIGGKGPVSFNPVYPKLSVVNTILGGRFTSLLNDALRVKSGYTYGARSGFGQQRSSGTFVMSTFTANETTFKTLDLALETYKSFLAKGVDQKTLDSAKSYVKGQYPPQYETLDGLTSLATSLFIFEKDIETINKFESEVDALTLAEANELVKTYLPKEPLTILMIGKASEIAEQAKTYGRFRQLPLSRVDSAAAL